MLIKKFAGKYDNFDKRILILSGVHGNETHAVEIAWQLYRLLWDTKDFNKHRVDFIFNLNEYGLEQDTRDNNYEKETSKNCNRLFPKRYMTSEEIKEEIECLGNYNLVLDIHNSPACVPCALIDYDEKADELLSYCKNTMILPLVRPTTIGTVKKYFNTKCLAYTLEFPNMGVNSTSHIDAKLVLDFIENIDKEPEEVDASEYLTHTLVSKVNDGIISYKRQNPVGTYKKDDVICEIYPLDSKGQNWDSRIQIVKAPYDGCLYDIDDNIYSYSGKEFGIYGRVFRETTI